MAGRRALVSWCRQFAKDFSSGNWSVNVAPAKARFVLPKGVLCAAQSISPCDDGHACAFIGNAARAYSGSLGTPGGPSGLGPEVFGDRTSQSVVTDDMLDSLIALKDFGNIQGLPPLDQILDEDEEREKKAMRREFERKRQLELDSKRVKTVDDLGRAYATGRRKTSIARVWLKEGEGKIVVNGKPHDVYFPDVDQRLQLLEPFCETSQLGVFDVRATVKGGGVSGQSGALRHGISKALQLYDPTLRPSLKTAGMLTRDSRVVERKKPGKAKARKSYQWVKR